MKYTTKALILALALPIAATAQTTTILSDNFNDNDRTNQNLTSSAQWFSSTSVGGGNLSVVEPSTGNFALKNSPTSGTVRQAVAYFAPSDAPVTLSGANQSLNFSFDITPTSANPGSNFNVLRFALLNSGSERQTTDGTSPSVSISGYGFFINPNLQRMQVRRRTTDSGTFLISTGAGGGWVDSVDDTGGIIADKVADNAYAMVQNTTYSISVTIARLANNTLDFSYSMSDGNSVASTAFNDASYLNYDFDSVAFGWGNAFGDGEIDNVLVTKTTAIPEPSSAAAMAGLVMAGAALVMRRRR